MQAPKHRHEDARLETLRDMGLTSQTFEESYDNIVELTQLATGMPICLFSVVDEEVQFFKAGKGLDVRETPRELAFCAWAIAQDDLSEPYVVEDASTHELFANNALVTGAPDIRFYAGMPVLAPNSMPVGTLCIIDTKPQTLSEDARKALKAAQWLLQDSLLLHAQSIRDHLTGIYNRRFFDEAVSREWRRAYRRMLPMAMVMIDIDKFKTYNDTYGHQAGDETLRRVAQALKEAISRAGDLLARYGGEEFVLILPDTDMDGLKLVMETLRKAVLDLQIPHSGSDVHFITISLGGVVAMDYAEVIDGPAQMISFADEAMYEAKSQGRNRSVAQAMGSAAEQRKRRDES